MLYLKIVFFHCYLILEGGKPCTVEDGSLPTTGGVELRTTEADELRITVGETVILQKFNYMRTHVLNPGKNLQLGRDIVNLSGKLRNLLYENTCSKPREEPAAREGYCQPIR